MVVQAQILPLIQRYPPLVRFEPLHLCHLHCHVFYDVCRHAVRDVYALAVHPHRLSRHPLLQDAQVSGCLGHSGYGLTYCFCRLLTGHHHYCRYCPNVRRIQRVRRQACSQVGSVLNPPQ